MLKKTRWAGPKMRSVADIIGVKIPPRYTESEERVIRERYSEPRGWHKGAKVSR